MRILCGTFLACWCAQEVAVHGNLPHIDKSHYRPDQHPVHPVRRADSGKRLDSDSTSDNRRIDDDVELLTEVCKEKRQGKGDKQPQRAAFSHIGCSFHLRVYVMALSDADGGVTHL